ncbi:hypothetical protein [Aeromicrobium sp. Leaf350]|uniref:hypothetical protein n=1 Tax=Aeromicrobium sp. Leaf350 TaxID=2876565 RepID=UPI001E2CBC04|nr:hypothetical protein [Aeromicrobium sp. Leaf350]
MSLKGSRRGLVVLAAIAVVSVVIALVVVAPWEGDSADEGVAQSSDRDFPTRGDFADETDLVDAAADAWRSGDSRDVRTEPEGAIELLWAGEVRAEVVDGVSVGDDTPESVPVVVLRSGSKVATFVIRDDGQDVDGLGIRELSSYPSPIIPLAGNLALAASGMPSSYEAADLDGSELTAESDDGLISSTESNEFLALRLDETSVSSSSDRPGVYVEGRVIRVDDDLDRIWSLLTDPDRAEALRAGLREVVGPRSDQEGGRLELPEVGIAGELEAPDGALVLVLEATGTGVRWSRAVVAVASGEPGSELVVARLGYDDGTDAWVGSAWITSEETAPYLVVAGGDGTERIEVRVATTSTAVVGAGIVVPTVVGTDNFLPDVVIAGFTADGTVVAAMPPV